MLAPNTLLNGRYRIEKLIGQGGMGAVYKAHAENLQLTVAVKEATVTDTRLLGAFEKEARRLARLRHSALPRVIDHFMEGYGHYLVMEFIEGEDLGDKLQARGQPLGVDEVVALGDQLLQVLEYLHRQQPAIIHRDIKPQNLKVMADGSLILLDFGLAKGGLTQQNPYGSHSLFGYSIGYAPPEQMNAQGTDERSDLYSVAATLWTLLTAQRAIDAQVREQAAKHGVPDPMRPANELNPQVPPLVAQALTNALALNPNHRPNSATQMRQQLQAEAERKRREQQQAEAARRQAEVERWQRETEAARHQAEAERKRRSQQQAQDAHRQAELEGLRREAQAARRQAEAANRQAKREKQQREAAERREADWKKQQRAAAHQQRTVRPVTPPSVTPPQRSTTATHYQGVSPPTNHTTSSIAPLSPINPLDHWRLLWWTLVMPQQLKAYRQQYGQNSQHPMSEWLFSTIVWLPWLLLVLALGLETLPPTTTAYTPTTYLLMGGGLLIGWLLTGMFGHRVKFVYLVILFIFILSTPSVIIAGYPGLSSLSIITLFVNHVLLRILVIRNLKGLFEGQEGLQTGLLVTEKIESLKTGHPSWFGRGVFGLLVATYGFLVWFCFLGGWQVFAQ